MKRRAGTVGERGLGRVVGQLAQAAPDVRVHLVGHSFGGRLVAFALRGLPQGVRTVKSVTLLQGAFSHYAFAARLPEEPHTSGVLDGQAEPGRRSPGVLLLPLRPGTRHAVPAGVPYGGRRPLAGRGLRGGPRHRRSSRPPVGAMGHDGVQAVDGTRNLALSAALNGGLPTTGCVNVDACAVVCHGGPPSGAHSDIVHRELAQVVLAAGRVD
jgi:pimeloyl-ACP methyl ester carboxylesterase